jgi:hypothetical protein
MSVVTPITHRDLPGPDDVSRDPRSFTLPSNEGGRSDDTQLTTFYGRFIGIGTSHVHGRDRWFEVRIFREGDARLPGVYYVHFTGASVRDGEVDRFRLERPRSAMEVLEVLVTRGEHRQTRFTIPAARCISQAAGFDPELEQAWVDRAVV